MTQRSTRAACGIIALAALSGWGILVAAVLTLHALGVDWPLAIGYVAAGVGVIVLAVMVWGRTVTGRLLSLFSGYGGLDRAIEAVLDVRTAYVADIDAGARKVLAHRFPDAPNLGDVTRIDWSRLGPVDVIAGGSPCQDVSSAGKRAGMTAGTRSNLWVAMRDAIAQLKPPLVVWENVPGARSAHADSEMEPCAGCVGDGSGVALRALGRVLGDLAALGFDAEWVSVRASDVGACHRRERLFVVAWPADAFGVRRGTRWPTAPGQAPGGWALGHVAGRGDHPVATLPTPTVRDVKGHNQRGDDTCLTGALLPTPRATDGTKGGPNQRGSSGDLMLPSAVALLPTPAVNDMGAGKDMAAWDAWTDRMRDRHGNNGHGRSLDIEARRLLPTPAVADATGGHERRGGTRGDELLLPGAVKDRDRWGQYADAITRHEAMLGRPAPEPTETAPRGGRRLSCRFDEWMMGLPAGWITDVPGITHAETIRLCGNGVFPQQAAHAVRLALAATEGVAA